MQQDDTVLDNLSIDTFYDEHIAISKTAPSNQTNVNQFESQLQRLQSNTQHDTDICPVTRYVHILNKLRSRSPSTANSMDAIQIAQELASDLNNLSKKLNHAADHYQVNCTGDSIVVKEKEGEHVILPTSFQRGAYLSHPHPEHHLYMAANDLPRLHIGKYTCIGTSVGINVGGNVHIGDAVWISPHSYLLMQKHNSQCRPSVAARTVAMTELTNIFIDDFAWIGKESVVAWKTNYIGKAAIVATRSFVNTWVGDYSTVGENGTIIQYAPHKAFLIETLNANLEDMMRISNWDHLNRCWLDLYRHILDNHRHCEPLETVKSLLHESSKKKGSILLDLNPMMGDTLLFAAQSGLKADGIDKDRSAFPFILQRLKDSRTKNVRLRQSDFEEQSLLSQHNDTILEPKKSPYYLIINIEDNIDAIDLKQLQQKLRFASQLAASNGYIILGTQDTLDENEIIQLAKEHGLQYQRQTKEKNQHGTEYHLVILTKT